MTETEMAHRKPYDLLMWVGETFYRTPAHFVREVQMIGLSKRIALQSLPKNVELGVTRIFLAHPKARLAGSGTGDQFAEEIADLIEEAIEAAVDRQKVALYKEFAVVRRKGTDAFDWLSLPSIVGCALNSKHPGLKEAVERAMQQYGVEFEPGVFCYVYYTGCSYTLGTDEELPRHLAEAGVEAHCLEEEGE